MPRKQSLPPSPFPKIREIRKIKKFKSLMKKTRKKNRQSNSPVPKGSKLLNNEEEIKEIKEMKKRGALKLYYLRSCANTRSCSRREQNKKKSRLVWRHRHGRSLHSRPSSHGRLSCRLIVSAGS